MLARAAALGGVERLLFLSLVRAQLALQLLTSQRCEPKNPAPPVNQQSLLQMR